MGAQASTAASLPEPCAQRPTPHPHTQPHTHSTHTEGMALAALFVTMPFVVRELLPILEQMDMAEEEAAR